MPVDPKTIEIWLGVRRPDSAISELQQEIDQLRRNADGLTAYQSVAEGRVAFRADDEGDGLYGALIDARPAGSPVTDDEIDATVGFLEDTFQDFPTYLGSDTSGLLSLATYDEYRGYLIDSGADSVDADEHISLLKSLFGAEDAIAADAGTHDRFSDFEASLESNGVDADTASAVTDDLARVYPSAAAVDRVVLGADSWDAVETAFEEAGLSGGAAADAVDALKSAYGSTLDSGSKDFFSRFDTYDEFKSYLQDNGFSADEADTFVSKVEKEYTDFNTFRNEVLADDSPGSAARNAVGHQTTVGSDDGLGIKVFEEAGEAADGTAMAAGDVAVRTAGKVNVVQAPFSGGGGDGEVSVGATTASASSVGVGETVRLSAPAENTGSTEASATVRLSVDAVALGGDRSGVVASRTVTVPPGETRNVTFSYAPPKAGEYDLRIGDGSPATVTATFAGEF
jgi:hypothetical protein